MTAEPKYDNLEVMKVHIDSSWVSLARLTKKQSMIKKCKKKKYTDESYGWDTSVPTLMYRYN